MNLNKRAGTLPYFVELNGQIKFLLMVPINPKYDAKPQIAKGRIEDGEDMFKTAMREAKEELGLKKKNMKRTPLHIGIWDKTDIFIVEVKKKDMLKKIDKDEVKKTIWLTIEDYRKSGRKSQRAVLELANIMVKRIMGQESDW